MEPTQYIQAHLGIYPKYVSDTKGVGILVSILIHNSIHNVLVHIMHVHQIQTQTRIKTQPQTQPNAKHMLKQLSLMACINGIQGMDKIERGIFLPKQSEAIFP